MVTSNPAKAFGIPHNSIEPGRVADLVFLKTDLDTLPITSAGENLLYSFNSRHVENVMIDGQWVLWDSNPVLISKQDMQHQYLEAVEKIKIAANLK